MLEMIILSLLANICKHFNYIRKRTLETLSTGKRKNLPQKAQKLNAKKLQPKGPRSAAEMEQSLENVAAENCRLGHNDGML